MAAYVIYDELGNILRVGSMSKPLLDDMVLSAGEFLLREKADPVTERINVTTRTVEAIPGIDAELERKEQERRQQVRDKHARRVQDNVDLTEIALSDANPNVGKLAEILSRYI